MGFGFGCGVGVQAFGLGFRVGGRRVATARASGILHPTVVFVVRAWRVSLRFQAPWCRALWASVGSWVGTEAAEGRYGLWPRARIRKSKMEIVC